MQAQRLGSVAATRQGPPRHPVQRTHRGRRPDRLRPRLQDGTRRHRLEAQGLHLPLRPLARLAQNEEPGGAGGEARGGGGMGQGAVAVKILAMIPEAAIFPFIFTVANALISAAVSWVISRLVLRENTARELLSEALAVQALEEAWIVEGYDESDLSTKVSDNRK